MPAHLRRFLPVVLVVGALLALVWYAYGRPAAAEGALSASGTIEATTITLAPEVAGRVLTVTVAEGEWVRAGQPVVYFDTTLITAQLTQAEASARAAAAQATAAQAATQAAEANLRLLRAGPTAEQLRVAQTVVDKAQQTLEAAQTAYDDLSEAARAAAVGQQLKNQLEAAQVGVANAQAQYDLAAAGARPQQIQAAQAQLEAAQAQASAAQAQAEAALAALGVLHAQRARLTVFAPLEAAVLARAIEPGEFAAPGSTLLQLADLNRLTLTVYLPEDRYGQVRLGQTATVQVDSFPGQTFNATVIRVADRAEFTPRNVQTAEGRKTTVFAIELALDNSAGLLRPGMPADVTLTAPAPSAP